MEVLLVKNGAAAEVRLVPSFKKFPAMTPAPCVPAPVTITTDLNWISASSRAQI